MNTREKLLSLANEASVVLGVSRNDAIAYGLRLVLSMNPPTGTDRVEPETVIEAAKRLSQAQGSFTMDDLLDAVYGNMPIFSPHKVKMFSAKLLLASGYTRRQFRRGNRRPLLWYNTGLVEEA